MPSPAPILWLLAYCCCYASPGAASVTQSPDISVPEGDNLTLSCCWSLEAQRFLVTWLKNGTALKVVQKVSPAGSLEASGCLALTLTEVAQEASGSYRCRVLTELPAYSVLEGNGTAVRVQGRRGPPAAGPAPQGGAPWQLLTVVPRSLPFLALILTFFCLRRAAAAPRAPPHEEGGGL